MNGRAIRVIGLTGGIGTGKSTVSAYFQELGACIVDADEISRHALDIGTACYRQAAEAFGREILLPSGAINRGALAGIVFAAEEKRLLLNSIIHPFVRKTIYAETDRAEKAGKKLAVWDIPLLFEGGYETECDRVIVVTCPLPVRLERLYKRSGMDEKEAMARINAQMSETERCSRADFILNNGGTLQELREQAGAVYRRILE